MSENGLTEIRECDFNFLDNLIHLNLSNNTIKTIHSDSFSSLKKLEYLSLGFNLIEKIEPASLFKNLISLKHLDLRTRNNCEIYFVNQNSSNCLVKLETLECSFKFFHDNFDSFRMLNYLKITDIDDYYAGSQVFPSPALKRISIEIDEITNNTRDFLKKSTGLEEIELKVNSDKATKFFIFDNFKCLRVNAAKINFIKSDLVYKNLNEFNYRNSFLRFDSNASRQSWPFHASFGQFSVAQKRSGTVNGLKRSYCIRSTIQNFAKSRSRFKNESTTVYKH